MSAEAVGQPSTAMLSAVQADLAKLDIDAIPGGRTYQATALWIARVIDKRGDDEGPSVTAKLADQLTRVMQALTKRGGDDGGDAFEEWRADLSEPTVGG